ncbi:MAG: Ig-like domain-containing protein [Bacteroidaceae bacterium]|nr:Ig-like domain-containing protein [Bacteroidaceae bacterium]
MFRRTASICAVMMVVLLVLSCANIGTPDGGPYDEDPPKVVRTSPKEYATNTRTKKIVLEFDENIKLDNATEKVMVSPPQLEMPEISAMGKRITIELMDTLKDSTTYTIDFSDAIEDNNEGNPMGDYAFAFSTGDRIDTFQMSGTVLNAENLEPIKGILVGLYSEKEDSVFRTKSFERVSRTNGSGHFTIKGIAPGEYRAYALTDQNQNFLFDQKSEQIAFSDRLLTPSAKPDIRPDTVWHDSIHYDSIVMTPYMHFFPDDIVLLAFTETGQDQYLLKKEREVLNKFTICFSAPRDTLPLIVATDFDASTAFVTDANQTNDTITYWIRDSLIYYNDTLNMLLYYMGTDTNGVLVQMVDTMELVSKVSKERFDKQRKREYEDWAKQSKKDAEAEAKKKARELRKKEEDAKAEAKAKGETENTETSEEPQQTEQPEEESEQPELSEESEKSEDAKKSEQSEKKKGKKKKDYDFDADNFVVPPMPETFVGVRVSSTSAMAPDQNIEFIFEEPIDTFDINAFHFTIQVDSTFQPADFMILRDSINIKKFTFYAEWMPDTTYQLQIDTGAFVSIYGHRMAGQKKSIKIKSLDTYSALFVNLDNFKGNGVVELLKAGDKVVKSARAIDNRADFFFITPGDYYIRMFDDRNRNGKWDTGEFDSHTQPEDMYYYHKELNLRAMWEVSEHWTPTARPRNEQKPEKLIKQKPDKQKSAKTRNEQRAKDKQNKK